MKRILSLLLSVVLVLSMFPTVLAAGDEFQTSADILYDLGLIGGTGTDASGNPIYELGRAPTRSEAITVLVKLLGKSDEAGKGGWNIPFTDVPDWAKNFVGYAYANGLTAGTSATTFGSNDLIAASQYITFVLKALGYSADTDFQWDKAWELSDKLGITDGRYNADTKTFLRGDVFLISEAALKVKVKGTEQTLAEKLISAGAFTKAQYDNVYGLSKKELTAEEIYAQCSPAVFFVEVYDEAGEILGTGSGFFLNSSGLAVTNYHVLDGATRAVITTSDTQQKYEVKGIYDFDKQNDWVVMQVDGTGFKSIDIGSADTVQGGATVFAIGSPRGLQNTISQGLISNPSRELDGVYYIQTSAPISPGSSGGALINRFGQVIGITSAGFTNGQNLNLAMPITVIENYTTSELRPISTAIPQPSVSYILDKNSVLVEVGQSVLVSMNVNNANIDETITHSIKSGDKTVATVVWDDMDEENLPWDIRITGIKAGQTTLTIFNDITDDIISIPIIVTAPMGRQAAAYNVLKSFIVNNYNKTLGDAKDKAYEYKSGDYIYQLVYSEEYDDIALREMNSHATSYLYLKSAGKSFGSALYFYDSPNDSYWSFEGRRWIDASTFHLTSTISFTDYDGYVGGKMAEFISFANLMIMDSLEFTNYIFQYYCPPGYSMADFGFNCLD